MSPSAQTCPHPGRTDGVCDRCGHCVHEVILNGACYLCGATDIDGASVSPRPVDVVPLDRLRNKPRGD